MARSLKRSGSPSLARVEGVGVDAPRPGGDVAEAVLGQLVAHGRRRHHQPSRRLVEPLHVGVARGQRQRQAGRDIFREPGVVAGGERQLPLHADAPRRQADRPFGGDMDGLRLEGLEALLNRLIDTHRHLDLGVGGQREGLELVGADHLDQMAHGLQLGDHAGQGADHAVDLRLPGVGGHQDAHGLAGVARRGDRLADARQGVSGPGLFRRRRDLVLHPGPEGAQQRFLGGEIAVDRAFADRGRPWRSRRSSDPQADPVSS